MLFVHWYSGVLGACPPNDHDCALFDSSDNYGTHTWEPVTECQSCVNNEHVRCGWLIVDATGSGVCTTANAQNRPCNSSGFSDLNETFVVDPDYCPVNTTAAEVGVSFLGVCLFVALVLFAFVVHRNYSFRRDVLQGAF